MKSQELVEVTPELSEQFKIVHLKDGGFQRALNVSRVDVMVDDIKANGSIVPPIVVARTKEGMIVVDGQHRLEAYRKAKYRLSALIVDGMTEKEATASFVAINRKARRVSLTHVLNVDPSEYATMVRKLGDKYGASNRQAHYALVGAFGRETYYKHKRTGFEIKREHLASVELVLATWSRDKRWDNDSQCFNRCAIIQAVTDIVVKAKNKGAVIKKLLDANYTRQGPLFSKASLSGASQNILRNWFLAYLFE